MIFWIHHVTVPLIPDLAYFVGLILKTGFGCYGSLGISTILWTGGNSLQRTGVLRRMLAEINKKMRSGVWSGHATFWSQTSGKQRKRNKTRQNQIAETPENRVVVISGLSR